jgi:hypothetical protein
MSSTEPPYSSAIKGNADDLYGPGPAARLHSARALSPRAATKLTRAVKNWPDNSPAAVNAWLLLVTTKPPSWRDPLIEWRERPLTVGRPHEGFLYPDPIGFWAEVRRWSVETFRAFERGWDVSEALGVTALIHVGGDPGALAVAMRTCRPAAVLFLDEPAWQAAAWDLEPEPFDIPDPHRPDQSYLGFWARRDDGIAVGKSPQHPTMHRFYDAADMTAFLRSVRLFTA